MSQRGAGQSGMLIQSSPLVQSSPNLGPRRQILHQERGRSLRCEPSGRGTPGSRLFLASKSYQSAPRRSALCPCTAIYGVAVQGGKQLQGCAELVCPWHGKNWRSGVLSTRGRVVYKWRQKLASKPEKGGNVEEVSTGGGPEEEVYTGLIRSSD